MPYGPASNCVKCKLLTSQILQTATKEHICADCLQKEYNTLYEHLESATKQLFDLNNKFNKTNKVLEQYNNLSVRIKQILKG